METITIENHLFEYILLETLKTDKIYTLMIRCPGCKESLDFTVYKTGALWEDPDEVCHIKENIYQHKPIPSPYKIRKRCFTKFRIEKPDINIPIQPINWSKVKEEQSNEQK